MKSFNRTFLFFTVFVSIALIVSACAKQSVGVDSGSGETSSMVFDAVDKNADGAALEGFDAVAYFVVDRAVEGNPTYSYVWNGAKWFFSNTENMEKFKKNPEAYAPQYGGYCSYAVSKGYTADGDPNAWKVVDGKLYLNYSPEVKEKWEEDQQENIKKAEGNWMEFNSKKPEH